MLRILPSARAGHIGLYRDPKTMLAVEDLFKVPEGKSDRDAIVVDPMLATGKPPDPPDSSARRRIEAPPSATSHLIAAAAGALLLSRRRVAPDRSVRSIAAPEVAPRV
jgi:hypothetical protein